MLKRRFMPSLVAVALLISLVCQGTWALAGTTGSLTGTVTVTETNGTTSPLANARVSVVSPSQSLTTTTDSGGHFTFLSLAPDTYLVSAEKTGYEPASIAGVNIFADASQTLTLATRPALREIGRVASRSPSSLVKPGTTTDVYSITAGQQDKIAAAGGGGTLNSAWSAIATVPGVFVSPNQAGYIGAAATLSIRGGDYDQIGYEVDGVPVNRAFDNYPSGPVSSLGQQELQVYTGVPPANAQANGLSGFINQVIRTGSYPGFATADLGIGGPSFYHKASFEIGGATSNRNFSYYLGLGGYNQDFRTIDQFNGAGISNTYGSPLGFCLPAAAGGTQANEPSCFTNGQYNANTLALGSIGLPYGFGGFYLGPANNTSEASVVDRDSVVNLHFGLNHKNGLKDDIQVLGMINYVQNSFYSSTNDQGGPMALAGSSLGLPFYVDGYGYNSPTGVPLQSNYQSLASTYQFTNVAPHPFDGTIPSAERDGFINDQAIYKLQYTHNFSSSALLKLYGYSYYSDWMNTGPQGAYADFVACCPADYELSSHTRGVSGTFLDQLDSKNLLNLTASYTTATTVRDNNTQVFNGFYGPNTVNGRTVLAAMVDSSNPTSGLCYPMGGGAATTCAFSGGAGFATLQQAFHGSIPNATGTCGGGPCEWFVVENGQYATYNAVKPTFDSGSLTDEWHPTTKLTINGGIRFDEFQYQGSDTTGTAARTLWYNAYNLDNCQDANHNLFDKVTVLGLSSPTAPCPTGYSSVNFQNPSGTPTISSNEFQPRFGATYSLDPFTVLRASYGRYAQGPNSAFVQYNALQQDAPNLLYGTYSFQKFGFDTPDHPIQPEVSNNFDFSVEHQFKGGLAVKLTPFLRTTQNQIQQFFLNQQTGFVSGLNVGKQTSEGAEFEVDKGDFSQQGLSGRLTFTYTNSYINYSPLSNGSSVLSPINVGIANYNAYTKSCAAGGHLAGSASCGKTDSGEAAAPCYFPSSSSGGPGAPDPSCGAGSIANPYWNAPAQGLLNLSGNYPTFDLLPQGVGSAVDAFGAPYVASLVLNERIKKFSIAPIVQMFAGQRYGAPASTIGILPDFCGATLSSGVSGDPRYPYGAPGGAPFDASSCASTAGSNLTTGIPDPYTRAFDGIGAFVEPAQLQLHLQMTYDVSRDVTLVANVTNIVNTCFGGTSVKWSVSNVCTYGVVGGGITGDVGNTYNPGSVIQPYINTPYEPGFPGFPFGLYINAKIKI